MKTRETKYLRSGFEATLDGTRGTLHKTRGTLHKALDGHWYLLHNNHDLDGSRPGLGEWDELSKMYRNSYWLANSGEKYINYEIELLYGLADMEIDKDSAPKPSGFGFNPKVGDILHIMSREDIKKYNKSEGLSGGGDYFGCHVKVKIIESGRLCCDIFDKFGAILMNGWWLLICDFYEYHGLQPSVYLMPDRDFLAFNAETSLISHIITSSSSRDSGGYVSTEKIKHPETRCTLPTTADWQVSGTSVSRKKNIDTLLILGT